MKSKTHNGNGYATENGGCGGGSSSSPSPPRSPPRHSAGVLHLRKKLRRTKSLSAGIVSRRSLRYFFLLPVVYLSGLLMCVGPFPFTLSSLIGYAPLPGSRYRSHEVFQKLWNEIDSDNSSFIEVSKIKRNV
jgi:hypothetical protein